MEDKFPCRNIFESGFESFDFDDGFLMKLDVELKKDKKLNENKFGKKIVKCKERRKQVDFQREKEKEASEIKSQCYNLPLFIEDLSDSDFFEDSRKKTKTNSAEIHHDWKNEKKAKASSEVFISCLSPIQEPKLTEKMILSSTPVKSSDESNSKENINPDENSAKNLDFIYSEADLFDDWDLNEINTDKCSQRSTVTISQAFKLIEEAESTKDADQKESLNQSIDLLTGEVISHMFEESFGLPDCQRRKDEQPSEDDVVIVMECKVERKPQKLHSDKPTCPNTEKNNELNSICFTSDDDFDFLTQDLLAKPKNDPKCENSNNNLAKSDTAFDLNETTDGVIQFNNKRRGKCFNVIDSDTTEDSPSPKFRRQNKAKTKKQFRGKLINEFIECEAEVSDAVEVSSDETDEDGKYDKSFLDEESYFTQNLSANMTSKYLESVKAVNRGGGFKIPAAKPFNPIEIFSQVPEENNTDYEIDSFCVNEVEEEIKSDLSDLEVAERILEMDRKRRRKKRCQKIRKIK